MKICCKTCKYSEPYLEKLVAMWKCQNSDKDRDNKNAERYSCYKYEVKQ